MSKLPKIQLQRHLLGPIMNLCHLGFLLKTYKEFYQNRFSRLEKFSDIHT